MKDRVYIKDLANFIDKEVLIAGFVDGRRDHGKLIFLDLRDVTGRVQMVALPNHAEAIAEANKLRSEWVIKVQGKVNRRPEKMISEGENGSIEIEILKIEILSEAETSPIPLDTDGKDIDEDIRNQFRYLDLRRQRLLKNIKLRHKVTSLVREFLNREGFTEIETPTLTKTSPEGARDFLVPSRFHKGKFYALPQSPQQYKQLLMIAGFEKYYQIAHAMRDEDLRGDRQLEHTQIDMEMSYVTEEEIRQQAEAMFTWVVETLGYKITQKPFPVYSHEQAIKEFGKDKFDIRKDKSDTNELAFAWVTDFPLFEKDEETGKLTFAHNPFSMPKSEHVADLMENKNLENLRAQQYDLVLNGYELASGGVRISHPEIQTKIFEIMGLTKEETKERFGHIIDAYKYGAPPHAGIAPGLDRFIMILTGEDNIREVIAFPVSSSGKTSVMDAPSEVSQKQLDELGIRIKRD